jgi:putative SOS response-associated peptidase YedK
VIAPNDRQPIAIAVICEEWRSGPETLPTFVMVTTPANALISRITDRMPAILPREAWPLWLGEREAPLTEVKALLETYDDGGNWTMTEQASSRPARPPKPPKPNPQYELF